MEVSSESAALETRRRALGRHALLLAALAGLIVLLPVLAWAPGHDLRFPVLMFAVLLAAIYAHAPQRWVVWASGLIGGAAIVGLATAEATGSTVARSTGDLLGLVLIAITTVGLIAGLVRTRRVDVDTIVGGICVYLLVAVGFALTYRLLIDFEPDAIVMAGTPLAEVPGDASALPARLVYFSFITLTTVGYGDITPRGELAQMLTACEAMIGQLYLAIFVARLMGLYMAGGRSARGGDASGA